MRLNWRFRGLGATELQLLYVGADISPVDSHSGSLRHGDQRVLQVANVFENYRASRGAGEGLGEFVAACNDVWMGGARGDTSTEQRVE